MSSRRIVIEFLGKDTSLGKTADQVGGKTSTLGSKLTKVGKIAALGLGAGMAVGAKFMWDAGKAAAEDAKSQALLERTLKNTTGANKEQVAAVEDWISAQGVALGVADDQLRPAMQRLAEATGDVGKAQELTSLAMDISAGTGKSLKSVSEALAKAQRGQVGALSRYGIQTRNAAGELMSFDDIAKKASGTFKGQAAASANTLEGKMGRLRLIFDETKETIGSKLLPVVTRLADWFLTKGLPAVMKFGGWLQTNLGPIFVRIGDAVKRVTGSMNGDVASNLGNIVDTVRSVVSIVSSLWNRFGKYILEYGRKTFQNLRQVVGGALKIISGVFKVFSSLLRGDWRGAWNGIKKILSGALDIILAIAKQALNSLKFVFRVAWSAIKGIVGGVWDGIKSLVRNGADWMVSQIKALPGRIRGLVSSFRDTGKALIGALVDGLKNAGGVVSGIAGKVWDAVKGMLNSAIDKINAALEFTIKIPGPDIHVNPVNIPHLAKGGIVNRPTLALIGEDGPEAVVPLGRKNAPRGRIPTGSGAGLTVVFTGPVYDKTAMGRELEKAFVAWQRHVGRPLQFQTQGS